MYIGVGYTGDAIYRCGLYRGWAAQGQGYVGAGLYGGMIYRGCVIDIWDSGIDL